MTDILRRKRLRRTAALTAALILMASVAVFAALGQLAR
ncbi:MAG: hypothetical protein JWQ17_763 [Tardiphaga sp.]|jgi:hypothetical protein|nr:hypothetical protein [Tardiphaga sp.]